MSTTNESQMMNMTLPEAVKMSGLKTSYIIEKVGIGQPSFSQYIRGERLPKLRTATAFAALFSKIFERQVTIEELFPKVLESPIQNAQTISHL